MQYPFNLTSLQWWYVNTLEKSEKFDERKSLILLTTGLSDTGFTMCVQICPRDLCEFNVLFQRFTDDEENDPCVPVNYCQHPVRLTNCSKLYSYCATRGLLFSHVGWIFFKPTYTKLHLIERDDLDQDPGSSLLR
jgi:hypothetical protein